MFDKYSMLIDSTSAVTADANGTPLFRTWMKNSDIVACLSVGGTISGTSRERSVQEVHPLPRTVRSDPCGH